VRNRCAESVGVPDHPVGQVAAVGPADDRRALAVDVGAGDGGIGQRHHVGVRRATPLVPAAVDHLLPVARRQRRVGQQDGVTAGGEQGGLPAPLPGVPGAERAAVDGDEQRGRRTCRLAVRSRGLGQDEPGPQRRAVLGGGVHLLDPLSERLWKWDGVQDASGDVRPRGIERDHLGR